MSSIEGKRILFLGGADIQVSAIKKAKEMGCYVITCDYLPNNPGHKFANEYYNVSTTDIDGVYNLAKNLDIDGILAYASDPAAPTAAYVAERLNLPTNPFAVVQIMSRKDLFRNFMIKNGFRVPLFEIVSNFLEAKTFIDKLGKRCIIKPVDSSGSKGIFPVEPNEDFQDSFDNALNFSRTKLVIVEEFIQKKGFQIGGDGFLVDGRLAFRCFGDIHFSKINSVLPCAVSVPSIHEPYILAKVHDAVQELLSAIGMKMGALNFDIMVSNDNEVFILEIGPRNGGNMIPELIEFCTGVDLKEYSIKTALGIDCSALKQTIEKPYFSHYVIHSEKGGTVSNIKKSSELESALLYEHTNFVIGDQIAKFNSSANRLGVMLLKYASKEEMLSIIENMNSHYKIDLIHE